MKKKKWLRVNHHPDQIKWHYYARDKLNVKHDLGCLTREEIMHHATSGEWIRLYSPDHDRVYHYATKRWF